MVTQRAYESGAEAASILQCSACAAVRYLPAGQEIGRSATVRLDGRWMLLEPPDLVAEFVQLHEWCR